MMYRICVLHGAFGFAENAETMRNNAQRYNLLSDNGALMRIAPIAYWAQHMDVKLVAEFARCDAHLSHASTVCQDANAVYAVALSVLLSQGSQGSQGIQSSSQAAFQAAVEVTDAPGFSPVVKGWLEDSRDPNCFEKTNTQFNIGHVKHAFTLGMHILYTFGKDGRTFDSTIHETLLKGGDTDTNACIVGYMAGALHGFESIPEYMRKPVIEFDCTTHDVQNTYIGHRRPSTYKQKDIFELV